MAYIHAFPYLSAKVWDDVFSAYNYTNCIDISELIFSWILRSTKIKSVLQKLCVIGISWSMSKGIYMYVDVIFKYVTLHAVLQHDFYVYNDFALYFLYL